MNTDLLDIEAVSRVKPKPRPESTEQEWKENDEFIAEIYQREWGIDIRETLLRVRNGTLLINPTRDEVRDVCRQHGVEPPPWPPPKEGWHLSSAFMMALERRLRKLEPPYCWQCKEALRQIREHLDGDSRLPFALLTYLALSDNASNRGTDESTTLQSYLAQLAGNISTRTIRRVLPILREIGVIDYTTPRLRGPIAFKLLAVETVSRNDGTMGPNDRTMGPNVGPGRKTALRPGIEITKKEQ